MENTPEKNFRRLRRQKNFPHLSPQTGGVVSIWPICHHRPGGWSLDKGGRWTRGGGYKHTRRHGQNAANRKGELIFSNPLLNYEVDNYTLVLFCAKH